MAQAAPASGVAVQTGVGTDVIIEARGVQKTYDTGTVRVRALRGLDLLVTRGEMVAIMGPSGCGKTTLLNCLSSLDTIDAGTIHIAGTDLSSLSDNARTDFRARDMGFVFQFYNLLPVLSAAENVELPLLVSGAKPRAARERALAVLEQVGLREQADQRPAELSGGQRQRVTIARALANEPAIVWADEPTGDLDSQTADDVMALMRDLNRTNRQTFVVVTHDPRIGAMCDRIIRMKDGVIVSDGDAAGV
ncbi:MAG TPA: ABC transporter ATP-binding protein [Thermomicrobiaceae bacterium]|nr:ABC transporter ATP-binding protein [Thermomicrobiaceae bacterium]